jgi:hypothetical protein
MPPLAQTVDTGNAMSGAANARRRVIGIAMLVQFPVFGAADRGCLSRKSSLRASRF